MAYSIKLEVLNDKKEPVLIKENSIYQIHYGSNYVTTGRIMSIDYMCKVLNVDTSKEFKNGIKRIKLDNITDIQLL